MKCLQYAHKIVEVKQTGKDIIPLMLEMTNNLEQFINLDVPFLMKERKKRLEEIKKIMDRADVSVSEKYRRLMEAYQVENEYGKTLESYQGIQEIKEKKTECELSTCRSHSAYLSNTGRKKTRLVESKK